MNGLSELEGDETVSKSRWYAPPPPQVQMKNKDAYQLQREHWKRQLKGHLTPTAPKLPRERESKHDTDDD